MTDTPPDYPEFDTSRFWTQQELIDAVNTMTADWSEQRKAGWFAYLDRQAYRKQLADKYAHPAQLAADIDPEFVTTPAIEYISKTIADTMNTPDGRAVISMSPQEGKLLEGNCPVLSVSVDPSTGLSTTMFRPIKELLPGDSVFHPSGHPVKVIAKTGLQKDRPLYRIVTSDDRSVIADAQHEWTVRDNRRSRAEGSRRVRGGPWETLTTVELLEQGLYREKPRVRASGTIAYSYAYRLPQQHVVQTTERDLPVPPYALGLWLADGSAGTAQITEGLDDVDELIVHLKDAGVDVVNVVREYRDIGNRATISVSLGERGQFTKALRDIGVFKNKHIPDMYLTSGSKQRLALLQGMLDGDGAIFTNGSSFKVEYSTCIEAMAEQFLLLVRSLGWRATLRTSQSSLNGERKLDRHRVCFTPTTDDMPPFRLARKQSRVQVDKSRGGERHSVTITSIEQVGTGEGYCIQVDSPDGLFLAGRDLIPTHNSTLISVWTPIWILQRTPDFRIMVGSYGQSLANKHSRAGRDLVMRYGSNAKDALSETRMVDRIGFGLSSMKWAAAAWRVDEHEGGMQAVALGSSGTGYSAEALIVDDPVKDLAEADSPTAKQRAEDWFRAVAMTRLAKGASVVVLQTRFAPDDLAGRLIKEGWPWVNIPAISEEGIPDALNRPPGVAMISARGRTQEDFERIRKDLGDRVFYALYQGVPTPTAGGLFLHKWFNDTRVEEAKPVLSRRVVAVDPAETGQGDEAGIIALGVDAVTGNVIVTHDRSSKYTSEQWALEAVKLAIETQATELVFEGYTAQVTYERVIKLAYQEHAPKRGLNPAACPFRIVAWRGKGNGEQRSVGARQAAETGKLRVHQWNVATLEDQCVNWQGASQHMPDRVSAMVIGFEHIAGRGTSTMSPVDPLGQFESGVGSGPQRSLIGQGAHRGMGPLPTGFGSGQKPVPQGYGPNAGLPGGGGFGGRGFG